MEMMMTYDAAKRMAVDLIDDFTPLHVMQEYGTKYKASTKLSRLGISPPIAASMPPRVNKVLRARYPNAVNIGSLDMVGVSTIGEFIILFCTHARERIPVGEPT